MGEEIIKGFGSARFFLCPVPFQREGKAINGTDNEVQRQGADDDSEPQGMINVEELQSVENLYESRAQAVSEVRRFFMLRDQCAKNRNDGQDDEQGDSEPDRTEEAPYGVGFFFWVRS